MVRASDSLSRGREFDFRPDALSSNNFGTICRLINQNILHCVSETKNIL